MFSNKSGEWWFGFGCVVVIVISIVFVAIGVGNADARNHRLRMEKVHACERIIDPPALTLCLSEVGA